MTRSCSGIRRRQRGTAVLIVATLAVAITQTARASDGPSSAERALPNASAATTPACTSACVAQQTLATALHEPIRVGSSHFRVGVGSSKVTIGWSLAF